jgi:hypothetical protein
MRMRGIPKSQLRVILLLLNISPLDASAIRCHTSEEFLSETNSSLARIYIPFFSK